MSDNYTIDQSQNNGSKNKNVVNINNCYTTPVVDAISAAHIYVDPAVWSKIIVHPGNKKPNWLAIHLFAKILYWYTRTEVRDEVSGKFLGYRKKFKYQMLQLSYYSICEQMGCTYQEARDALKSLLAANLVINPKSTVNGLGNVMFIEPIPENILCIINPKGVDNDPLCVPRHRGSVSPGTEGLCPQAQSLHVLPTCTTTLTSTYDFKADQTVDNSEQLPTVQSPTNKIINNKKIRKENKQNGVANLDAEFKTQYVAKPDNKCLTNEQLNKENENRQKLAGQLKMLTKQMKLN